MNLPSERQGMSTACDAKITILLAIFRANAGVEVEQAGSKLDKIVTQSLRQAPPAEAPLMAWPVVCGSAVAERTRALNFQDGVLSVAVPDIGWRSELQTLAPRYLAAINRYTVEMVRRIDFVISHMDDGANPGLRRESPR